MSMLLTSGLPEEYEGIPIYTDFRNMIQVDLIYGETGVSEYEKSIIALRQLYPEIPKDLNKAVAGLSWFYSCGKITVESEKQAEKVESVRQPKAAKRPYCYKQDANLIYAAFYATYKISLTTIDYLHWWEFMALFEALPEETMIKRVMYWRAVDLSTVSKTERKHILKMRSAYALKEEETAHMTVEELEQKTKDRVAKRFAQAAAAAGEK